MSETLNTFEKKLIRHGAAKGTEFGTQDIFKAFLFDETIKEVDAEVIDETLLALYKRGYLRLRLTESGNKYSIAATTAAKLRKTGVF